MDYKDTLLMPKTDFKMKAGLVNNEPKSQDFWRDNEINKKRDLLNKSNEQFVLHDGPPYANGNLHLGHALNKILKDFVIRTKSMQGYYSPYIPGWDTHGLPIEQAITNSGVNRKDYSVSDFRKMCEKYALEQIENQKKAFQEYNVLGNWDNPYITLKPKFEEMQIDVFARMVERGLIYKGLRPVYWSPSSESALAEAEIEYKEKEDNSIYVKFNVINGKNLVPDDASFVAWTTMPWTLPGTLALAVHESVEYGVYETKIGTFILATELSQKVANEFEVEFNLVNKILGRELEGIPTTHPLFSNRICDIVLGEHVTTTDGTGCVTTAPGHGSEDFLCAKKYGIEILVVCDDHGVLNDNAGKEYSGLFYEQANDEVIENAKKYGTLVKSSKIIHSYPFDWRTKKPIIFRATAQWFASIEKIREEILNVISNQVQWHPKWGQTRMYNMIKDRGDWCISRQRVWGVPIPIFYDESGMEIMDPELMRHVGKLFGEHGSNIWFDWDTNDLLPEGYTHKNSPNGKFTKETDIMDVWFDSGSSHHYTFSEYGIKYPCQMYLEGSDQFRGWFNSSLITGVAINNQSPYENVLSHGFLLDGKGYAMSKSLGNTIDPRDLLKQFGADILRLWVASVDYQQDTRMSIDVMKQISESYRKIRNTFRYMDGNLNEFNYEVEKVEFSKLDRIDKYMLTRLNSFVKLTINSYNSFDYQTVYKELMKFINFISSFYFEYAKDSLYADLKTSPHRMSIQTVLYEIHTKLMTLFTPILPHTMDELYLLSTVIKNKKESIYLENFPSVDDTLNDEFNDIILLLEIRKDVLKAMEVARENGVIGKSLEAHVRLNLSSEMQAQILSVGELKELFVCSKVEFTDDELPLIDKYQVSVNKMNGDVCPRCWNIYEELDELCERCKNSLK